MSMKNRSRSFSTPFKVALIVRADAGEPMAALAAEAGIRRKLIYAWRHAFRAHGEAGLRGHDINSLISRRRRRAPSVANGLATEGAAGRSDERAADVLRRPSAA